MKPDSWVLFDSYLGEEGERRQTKDKDEDGIR